MVKFRGIEVGIVSQFDIRKLPEFGPCESNDPFHQEGPALRSDDNSVASCYVPIYPGSQIWFEYSIDAPHPPDASYFFKMLHNGQVVTSWHCTAKHGYHGKTTYNIKYIGNDKFTGMPLVKRQAFKFSPRHPKETLGPFDDCIEFRVHRIEHRQRVSVESSLSGAQPLESSHSDGLCLVDGGLLEHGYPHRRYRYQLLDPIDEPYATIRFYYRSYAFLEDQKIVSSPAKISRSNSTSSSGNWSERSISLLHKRVAAIQQHNFSESDPRKRAPAVSIATPPACNFQRVDEDQHRPSLALEKKTQLDYFSPPWDSEESLRVVTNDSLEDLHTSLVRSIPLGPTNDVKEAVGNHSRINTLKKLQKKSLTLKIDGADFELEKKKQRPLSPFNSAGALRRMMSPTPPSAPAVVTEFGPTVAQEVEAQLAREKECRKLEKAQATNIGTTRAERGGKILLGFLGRRIGRAE